jgi:hypothetical protein
MKYVYYNAKAGILLSDKCKKFSSKNPVQSKDAVTLPLLSNTELNLFVNAVK